MITYANTLVGRQSGFAVVTVIVGCMALPCRLSAAVVHHGDFAAIPSSTGRLDTSSLVQNMEDDPFARIHHTYP